MFQKMIEIENFQKLHRNRCVENTVRNQLIEDIVQLRLIRERSEKFFPYLGQIYHILSSRYGVKPNQHVNYTPAQITAFVDELKEIQRQQEHLSTPSTGRGCDAMDVDIRTPCSNHTPMMQGASISPAGSRVVGMGGATNPGASNSLFRAHVQSEMRREGGFQAGRRTTPIGERSTPIGSQSGGRTTPCGGRATPVGSQHGGRTTPISANRSKPSPLLTSSRAVSAQPIPPQHQQYAKGRESFSPHYQQVAHRANLPSTNLQPSTCTPTHVQIRQAMLSSGPQANQQPPMSAPLGLRSSSLGVGSGKRSPIKLGQRPAVLSGPRALATPVGLSVRPLAMPMSVRGAGSRAVMLSSMNRMPQLTRKQCMFY